MGGERGIGGTLYRLPPESAGGPDSRLRCDGHAGAWQPGESVLPRLLRLPLYVFCGDQLLTAYLRPSGIDAAKHSAAILKLLITRLRRAWPRTKIVFRADSGFCRDLLASWCDRHDVKYVVGLARNERLLGLTAALRRKAEKQFARTQKKQRLFTAFDCTAGSWRRVRWVIAKAEDTDKGSNPRFILTNIVGDA